MARPPRIEYEGAFYHVMARGDRRQEIFQDDQDRHLFLELVGQVCARTGWKLHSWVLMNNHYHWLLETPEPNLVAGMKWFMGVYTQKFNRRHRICGHLFQGRYKAIPVEEGEYLLRVSDYIHLNPVRARMLDLKHPRLESYAWSSYAAWVKGKKVPSWSPWSSVLGWCGLSQNNLRSYQARMARLVQQSLDKGIDWNDLKRGWALGGAEFIQEMVVRAGDWMRHRGRRGSYAGEPVTLHDQARAQALLIKGITRLGIKSRDLVNMKKTDARKRALAVWIKSQSTVGNAWLTSQLYMGHPANAAAKLDEESKPYFQILISKD